MKIEDIYDDYLQNLLAGNRSDCKNMLTALLEHNTSIRDIYIYLFQRSMYEVGNLWELNKISVATEHLCTSITESLINLCYPLLFAGEHTGKKAVITCTPGEYHQIGARMVADFFEFYGWDGYFLGADPTSESLISFIREKQPDLVAISVSISFNIKSLYDLALQIRERFPTIPIVTGGQAFRWCDAQEVSGIEKLYVIRSLDELVTNFLTTSAYGS